ALRHPPAVAFSSYAGPVPRPAGRDVRGDAPSAPGEPEAPTCGSDASSRAAFAPRPMRSVWLRRTGRHRRSEAHAPLEEWEATPRGRRSPRPPHRTGTPPEGGAASRRGAQPPPLAGRFPRLIGDPPDDCGTVPLAHRRPFRRWSAPGTAAVDIGRT